VLQHGMAGNSEKPNRSIILVLKLNRYKAHSMSILKRKKRTHYKIENKENKTDELKR